MAGRGHQLDGERARHKTPEERDRRERALNRAAENLVACTFHAEVRYPKDREGGCPKCEHLWNQGRRPDGRYRDGFSGNPNGAPHGQTPLRRLISRYARAKTPDQRTFQEQIARRIVENAAAGIEPYLSIYLQRYDPVVKEIQVELNDHSDRDLPDIPDDEERDRAVAVILADLHQAAENSDATADELFSRLVEGTETEQ